jgi:hypothetical protein
VAELHGVLLLDEGRGLGDRGVARAVLADHQHERALKLPAGSPFAR